MAAYITPVMAQTREVGASQSPRMHGRHPAAMASSTPRASRSP